MGGVRLQKMHHMLCVGFLASLQLFASIHAMAAAHELHVGDATFDELRKLRAEAKFVDLPGAPADVERRRLEPLINDLLDRLIAGLHEHATRAWVIHQMDPTVAKFYLEDTEARERCVVYLDRIFSILRMSGPEGAFQKYMLDWRTPLQPNKRLQPTLGNPRAAEARR